MKNALLGCLFLVSLLILIPLCAAWFVYGLAHFIDFFGSLPIWPKL